MSLLEGNLRITLGYYDDVMSLGRVAEIIAEVTGQHVLIASPTIAAALEVYASSRDTLDLAPLVEAITGKEVTSIVVGFADE